MKNPSAIPKPVPSAPPRTKIAMPRQSLFMVILRFGASSSAEWFQAKSKQRGHAERQSNPGDAGRPSDPIENLAEDRRAGETAGEVTGEINAARRAAVCSGGAADESGGSRLREERADADEHHAQQDRDEIGQQHQRQANTRHGQG